MLDLDRLNPEQLEAVKHIDGPMLVLACAGSGKTMTMTTRTAYMISQGISPENILMLTFTNKAANEMKERMIKMLDGDEGNKVTACTFHSFCALMLRRYGEAAGISSNFTILSPGDDEDIIAIVKSEQDKTRYKGRGFPPNSSVCGIVSMAVNKNLGISEVMRDGKYVAFTNEVIELGKLAGAYRKNHNMLNYDDILVRFVDLLGDRPDIAEKIARSYQYIMVDEYQDTNPLQEAILLELFKYTKNIAVVGDDMQSLYGFRGAVVDNIIHFPDKFDGCKTVTLVRNYRSNQEILDLGNKVCEWATEGIPKNLIGTHHAKRLPMVISTENQHKEAEYVVELIRRLHADGIPYSDICVVERNSFSSASTEVMLNKLGIEFEKYGGAKFTDLAHVKDILAYLKIMINPHDEIAWFRVLQVHRGIGNVYARRISEKCRLKGFDALLDKAYAKKQYGPELVKLHDQLQSCEGQPLTEMLKRFIDFYYDTHDKNIDAMVTDEGSRTMYKMENNAHKNELFKLLEMAEAYRSVSAFLDDLLLDNAKKSDDNEGDKLVISTIHSVKGLEYDTVIMLDCVDGIFPNADEEGSKEDNEELRCFYVAVTRAKNRLYLMCPRSAMRFGQSIPGIPSRYLKEAQGVVRSNDNRFFDRFKTNRYDDFDDFFGGWNRRRYNPYR